MGYGTSTSNARLENYPNPFATFSRTMYPRTIREVFDWAEYMWMHYGLYSQAIKKSVRYFITDIEIMGDKENPVDYDTRKKYEEFLKDNYNILEILSNIGDDYIGFGNSFTSIYVPIERMLVCPKCSTSQPIREIEYRFEEFEFVGECKGCNAKNIVFTRKDNNMASEESPVQVIRWNPRDIVIDNCPITDRSEYYLDIPQEWKEKILSGDRLFLEEIPWEFVEAIKEDTLFQFNKEYFKHIKCASSPTLINTLKGWGMPMFMAEFEQVVYLQILDRFNEAIALDYLSPFRVITPPPGNGPVDPVRHQNMGKFMGNVRSMLKDHRRNPTTWHTLPFPVEYQALGGEGQQMAPVELMDRGLDDLLTTMGIPQEFYRGSLGAGNYTPIGLRLFEKVWGHHTSALNDWLSWFLDVCANLMTWEQVTGKLVKSSIHEDDMVRQLKLDMQAAGQISKHTAWRTIGVDPDYERERMIEEQQQDEKRMAEEAKKAEEAAALEEQMVTPPPMTMETMEAMQAEQQAAAQGGGAPAPGGPGGMMGAPAPGGGPAGGAGMGNAGPASSIDELMAQADQMAQQIMTMDPTTRRRELTNLKKNNETLHAQVKQSLQNMEQEAGMQGKMMARQGQM